MTATDPEELDYLAGCAFRDGDLDKARGILVQAAIEHPDGREVWAARLEQVNARAEAAREATPDVPPVGIHRDGGPTTRAIYGTFPRSPEPPEPHHCPGCTYEDSRGALHGPKIEDSRELCQSCEVLISIGSEPPEISRAREAESGQIEAGS